MPRSDLNLQLQIEKYIQTSIYFLIFEVNVWDFSIEKWDIENIAKCRSDAFGNVIRVSERGLRQITFKLPCLVG